MATPNSMAIDDKHPSTIIKSKGEVSIGKVRGNLIIVISFTPVETLLRLIP